MKLYTFIVVVFCSITFFCIPPAIATNDPQYNLINDLYKKHPPNIDKYWLDNKKELSRYFTRNLTLLFIKDDKCKIKTGGICNLDFDPIIGAQDFDNPNFELKLTRLSAIKIKANFINSGKDYNMIFVLIDTSNGWKICNIIYDGGLSLVKLLSGTR